MNRTIDDHIAELRQLAIGDAEKHKAHNVSLNPFSTLGSRHLWQQGWDGVRPANLVDTSINWRMWERGRQARIIHDEAST